MSTRKQRHDLLVRAKTLLARNASEAGPLGLARFVCTAVRDASDCDDADGSRYDLRVLIRERMGGISTLEEWLEYHHGILGYPFSNHDEYLDKMQATRHAWIDSLIEEFK